MGKYETIKKKKHWMRTVLNLPVRLDFSCLSVETSVMNGYCPFFIRIPSVSVDGTTDRAKRAIIVLRALSSPFRRPSKPPPPSPLTACFFFKFFSLFSISTRPVRSSPVQSGVRGSRRDRRRRRTNTSHSERCP